MELLTDGTENNPLLGFCLAVISRYAEKWPPTEQVLADDFVNWFGAKSFMTPTAMRELCLAKGITLSFVPLPSELQGLNCSFHDKKEIVISEREMVPFAHVHTLFHEFREMLERVFVELGHATLTPKQSLEAIAEEFAMAARMETATTRIARLRRNGGQHREELASLFWLCVLIVFSVAYMFSCALPASVRGHDLRSPTPTLRTYITLEACCDTISVPNWATALPHSALRDSSEAPCDADTWSFVRFVWRLRRLVYSSASLTRNNAMFQLELGSRLMKPS